MDHGHIPKTTTPTFEGRNILRYIGIVNGETFLSLHALRDAVVSAANHNYRSHRHERALSEARRLAYHEIEHKARLIGANAIVGVEIRYNSLEDLLLVTISGTAVELEDPPPASKE